MLQIYGISNCDTVKKARRWLDQHGLSFTFVDYRKDPLDKKIIKGWLEQVGSETLLNKKSRTWRELPDTDKDKLTDSKIVKLLLDHPTLIKRPVLIKGSNILVGFDAEAYKNLT